MQTILFQGDSITDCSRGNGLGTGYALLTAAELGCSMPTNFNFINRGISGSRIVDLYARINKDFINLKPDVISILIGVNDVWHEINEQNGVEAEKFETIYSMLVEEIKAALPEVKIMILEPFCLRGTATDNTEENPNKWHTFDTEVRKRAVKAKAVAEKYGFHFIPLQDKFDLACQKAEPSYWLRDGVHPTPMGHEIIKNAWIEGYNKLY